MNCDDITVIICTKNVEATIERTIRSIVANNPGEIIVVDAHSTDKTRSILEKYNVRILTDPGKGLAMARQIGIEAATKKYIFFCGDDNTLSKGTLARLKEYMLAHGWIGAGMLTRIRNPRYNYWTYGSNTRWILRYYEGEREVIGTPYLFYADVLKKAGYDARLGYADDADIEKRILENNPDCKMGYSNVVCLENAKANWNEIKSRFWMYGKSDYQYWKKYSGDWGWRRKLQSILHPLRAELIEPMGRIKSLKKRLYLFPYFLIITFIRYEAWVKCARSKQWDKT